MHKTTRICNWRHRCFWCWLFDKVKVFQKCVRSSSQSLERNPTVVDEFAFLPTEIAPAINNRTIVEGAIYEIGFVHYDESTSEGLTFYNSHG